MIVLACDCGLATFGWAVLDVEFTVRCVGAGVILTEKGDGPSAQDNTRRVRELAAALVAVLDRFRPLVICSETMSFTRGVSASAKLAMGRAVLDTLAEVRGLPVLQVRPQELKKHLAGNVSASKEEVAMAVRRRLRSLAPFVPQRVGDREHVFDAAAVGLTCLSSTVIRALRAA